MKFAGGGSLPDAIGLLLLQRAAWQECDGLRPNEVGDSLYQLSN